MQFKLIKFQKKPREITVNYLLTDGVEPQQHAVKFEHEIHYITEKDYQIILDMLRQFAYFKAHFLGWIPTVSFEDWLTENDFDNTSTSSYVSREDHEKIYRITRWEHFDWIVANINVLELTSDDEQESLQLKGERSLFLSDMKLALPKIALNGNIKKGVNYPYHIALKELFIRFEEEVIRIFVKSAFEKVQQELLFDV